MYALAGSELVALGGLARPPMNYGQYRRRYPDCPTAPYTIHVEMPPFIELFQPVYDEYIRDARDDAENFPEDWPELSAAAEAGYPPFKEVPRLIPEFLSVALRESLEQEMLDAVLTGWTRWRPERNHEPIPPKYFVDSVDYIAVNPEWMAVSGQAVRNTNFASSGS